MKSIISAAAMALLMSSAAAAGKNEPPWTEGQHYFLIVPAQPTSVPKGKVEITEVFSYGCPACGHFVPVMSKLMKGLPANAVVDYLPAGFNPSEDWPMFQRAYLTAHILGIADRVHEAMFDAVWKTGELAIFDPSTKGLKNPLPTIEDAARFYNRTTGVSVKDFLDAAKSMVVETQMGQADSQLIRDGVSATPTIIVNGKYRLDVPSAGGPDELIELVKWLVTKETR
jgi:thiol:disulfide interchange protein DsbA